MKAWIAVVLSLKVCGIALAAGRYPVAGALVFFAPDPWLFLQFILASAQGFGPAATAFATDRRPRNYSAALWAWPVSPS